MSGVAKKRNAKKLHDKKRGKGGARRFVASAEEMEARDRIEEMKEAQRKARRHEKGSDESEEEEEESEEEEEIDEEELDRQRALMMEGSHENGENEDAKPFHQTEIALQSQFRNLTFDQLKAQEAQKKSQKKTTSEIHNPNKQKVKAVKMKDVGQTGEKKLSRREREALEKERAAAAYMRKHLAGETEEAKKDLARLEEVRRRREEAKKRREEEEIAANQMKKKKEKEMESSDEEEDILDARTIKAMKPGVLKDHLKKRNLSIQGQKKELIQRLIDYENERAL